MDEKDKEIYGEAALEEWKRQLKNRQGVGGMYRSFFPDADGEWDTIMESYIKKIGWVAFAFTDSLAKAEKKDLEKAAKDLAQKKGK